MVPITLICMIVGLITGYILAGCYLFVFKFHNEKLFGLFVNDTTETNTTIDFSMVGLLVGMFTGIFIGISTLLMIFVLLLRTITVRTIICTCNLCNLCD